MIWLEIIEEAIQWFLIITLLLAYKMHDDKLETIYKTAMYVLDRARRRFEEERAERCSKESETNSRNL